MNAEPPIISRPSLNLCYQLQKISIGSSIQIIKDHAFNKCKSLQSIEFADDDNREDELIIEQYAFNECSQANLENGLPSFLTSIGQYAFYKCGGITEVTFHSRIESIGSYCFAETGLRKVIFECELKSTSEHLFDKCSNLVEIDFPIQVETIGKYSYASTSITHINLPSSVILVDQYAFLGCKELITFTIPAGSFLENIDYGAFSGCEKFKEIKTNCSNYIVENDALYDSAKKRFFLLPPASTIKYFAFPESLETIGQGAMIDCFNIVTITIPDGSLKKIDNYAFVHCINLRTINLPLSVEEVGSNVFQNCSKLQCGLFIENKTPDSVNKLIDKSLLPRRCLKQCIQVCTPEVNNKVLIHYTLFTVIFISKYK